MTSPTNPQVPSAERREEVQALYDAAYGRGFRLSDTFWRFIAALDAQSAERARAEVEALKSEHERIMAECYQAVGMISESLECQDDENYIRLLDMLAYGKTQDGKELLPFPVLPNVKSRAEVEKMREAAAKIADSALFGNNVISSAIRALPIENPSINPEPTSLAPPEAC